MILLVKNQNKYTMAISCLAFFAVDHSFLSE